MVILHTETLKRWGGQQNRILKETTGLTAKGHKIIIACHKGSMLAQKSKEHGIKIYEVNMVKQDYISTILKLVKIIKRENVELVATHSSVDSWAGGLAAKFTGRKLVRFRHNIYEIGKNSLTRFIYSIPDVVVCISDEVKRALLRSGIKDTKMKVINSSVDIQQFNPRSVRGISRYDLGISGSTLFIGNTSSFTKVKGQEYLLRAFNMICRKHPSYLVFATRILETSKERYLAFVEEEFRKRVIFLGHRNDVPEVLKSIDIFVFPSSVEGLGTSLIEAMAMEKPVVVSDIPTFRDFIIDGINGLFFNPTDPKDLAEKIISLIEKDTLRRQLGLHARSTALEKFSFEKMIDLTEILYREILNAR